jgi:hypothetical protein
MTTYAAAIAARLQGREDEDMGKDESVEHELDDVMAHLNEARKFLYIVMTGRTDPDEDAGRVTGLPVAYQAAAERVAELERELAVAREAQNSGANAYKELERELETVREQLLDRERDLEKERAHAWDRHQDCYVAREVPWTDVAAGMMTIARDGTPWMVVEYDGLGTWVLQNRLKEFHKVPSPGETVRVLEPYVTDEQAQGLVASVLGGTEMG